MGTSVPSPSCCFTSLLDDCSEDRENGNDEVANCLFDRRSNRRHLQSAHGPAVRAESTSRYDYGKELQERIEKACREHSLPAMWVAKFSVDGTALIKVSAFENTVHRASSNR